MQSAVTIVTTRNRRDGRRGPFATRAQGLRAPGSHRISQQLRASETAHAAAGYSGATGTQISQSNTPVAGSKRDPGG